MRSDGTGPAAFEIVPEGPPYARSAFPPLVWILSPRPLFGFGSELVAALKRYGPEFWVNVFTAASAFVEKGQNAFA